MLQRLKDLSYENTPRGKTTRTCLELITGMKQLNVEETKQAIIDHQKLWVAHFSIRNHSQAHAHYELFRSMLSFSDNPEDFITQKYYSALAEKKPQELTPDQVREVVELYEFAIERSDPLSCFSFSQKLQMYQSLLS